MTDRTKTAAWFFVPAIVFALALTAISLPGLAEAAQTASQMEAIIALLLFATVGGAIAGGLVLGVRHLTVNAARRRSGGSD